MGEEHFSYTFKFLEAKTGAARIKFLSSQAQARQNQLDFRKARAGGGRVASVPLKGAPASKDARVGPPSDTGGGRVNGQARSAQLPPLIDRSGRKGGTTSAARKQGIFGIMGKSCQDKLGLGSGHAGSPPHSGPVNNSRLVGMTRTVESLMVPRPASSSGRVEDTGCDELVGRKDPGDLPLKIRAVVSTDPIYPKPKRYVPLITPEERRPAMPSCERVGCDTPSSISEDDDSDSCMSEDDNYEESTPGAAVRAGGAAGPFVMGAGRAQNNFVEALSILSTRVAEDCVTHTTSDELEWEGPSFESLPDDLVVSVLQFATPHAVCSFGMTNKRNRALSKSDYIWKQFYESRWDQQNGGPPSGRGDGLEGEQWCERFGRRVTEVADWFRCDYRADRLSGHTESVMCVKMHGDSTMVSGSRDGTCRVWDLNTRTETLSFASGESATQQSVCRAVCMSDDVLVSAFGAALVAIPGWQGQAAGGGRRSADHRFGVHQHDVSGVALCNNTVVASADSSGMVMLWDLGAGGTNVDSLKGHTESVNSLVHDHNNILTACADGIVRVYDVRSFLVPVHSFSVSNTTLSAIACCGWNIASGGVDHAVHLWDTRFVRPAGPRKVTDEVKAIKSFHEVHQDWISDLVLTEDMVVSAGWDGNVCINQVRQSSPLGSWDTMEDCKLKKNGFVVRQRKKFARPEQVTMRHHGSAVYGVLMTGAGLVSCGADKDIYLCTNHKT